MTLEQSPEDNEGWTWPCGCGWHGILGRVKSRWKNPEEGVDWEGLWKSKEASMAGEN